MYGGSAGSLEEERKKAWNTKDLPVLETARSLLGVDIRLKEGESREYVYTFQIPHGMPPTHRGRAYRFAWDFNLSLAVADASNGKVGMRTREIEVPIRVWSHVARELNIPRLYPGRPLTLAKSVISRWRTMS